MPETRRFQPADAQADFQCRSASYAVFLREQALDWQREELSSVWVLPGDGQVGTPAIKGYYTLSTASITTTDFGGGLSVGKPPPKIPAVLLGKLARDLRTLPEERIGEWLISDAIRRALQVRDVAGCRVMSLHAEVPELVSYYQDRGFRAIGHARFPRLMILDLRTAAIANADDASAVPSDS